MDTTIAAISTAMSESGIGIVRISGPEAFHLIKKIFIPYNKEKNMDLVSSHTIHYGYIYDKEEMIDEVLVMIMKAPHTYTGEHTVEIDCHGGVYAMKRVLDTALKYGAELAEPGEFTKRAFLNGRIDLSRAEAVMDVIRAKNDYALQSSVKQLRGSVYQKIKEFREALLYQIAYIESALDDPEHISLEGYAESLASLLLPIQGEVDQLLLHSSDGRILREGIRTVILGKPNAGKSSLLNCLLGEERAIVTEIAGTTRDTLEEYVNLKGITLKIMDTAGIRETEDVVEKIGVTRALAAADDADLILYVVDSSTEYDNNDEQILSIINKEKCIVLYNKTDLKAKISIEEIMKKTSMPVIPISVKTEEGLSNLIDQIQTMFFSGNIHLNDEILITNIRHKRALEEAQKSLSMVQEGIRTGISEDFLSIDLIDAYTSLGKIIGESVEDDLVNEIFGKFCMGK